MSGKNQGIGECLICGVFIDDPEDFTCGNPHCNQTLRENYEKTKEFLHKHEWENFQDADDYITGQGVIIAELKKELRSIIMVAQKALD